MSKFGFPSPRAWINEYLHRQLIVAFGGISLFIMLALTGLLLKQQREFLNDANVHRITALANGLARSSQSWVLANDLVGLDEIVQGYADLPHLLRIFILSPKGEVLASTKTNEMGRFVNDPISLDLLQRSPELQILIVNEEMIDVAAPILNRQRLIGWARVEITQAETKANLHSLFRTHFEFIVITTLLIITAATALGRRISKRLSQLSIVAQQIANGNREVRAENIKLGEIGRLASNINQMLDTMTQSERALAQLNRIYAAWTECVNMIARESRETALLNQICGILVKNIGLRLTFIAFTDANGDWLDIVASSNWHLSYLKELKISVRSDRPEGQGPLGRAIRLGQAVVSNDFQADPNNAPWLYAARAENIRSVGAFPLSRGKKIIGGIVVYSSALDFFNDDMVTLLNGLSADISLALDNIDRETLRQRSEIELRLAASVFDNSQEGILITDARQIIIRVNSAFTQLTGYEAQEVIGHSPRMLDSGLQDAFFFQSMWMQINSQGYWQGEIINRRKNGALFTEWLCINRVLDVDGHVTHYVGVFTDITERKTNEDRIHKLAFYDPLTNLPNRRLLIERLRHALVESQRSRSFGTVMFMDLDRFKMLNDTHGHEIGDQLLVEVGHRLTACVREQDTIARLGGDEFVIMLEYLSEEEDIALAIAQRIANKILNSLQQPFHLHHVDSNSAPMSIAYHTSASIGMTLFSGSGVDRDELLKQADVAMYQAKQAGRNMVCAFNPEMQAHLYRRAALEADMHHALRERQFCLYYQAQVQSDGRIIGAEALLRWQHPLKGWIPPSDFISLAEESGMIDELGLWALEEGCKTLADWSHDSATNELTLSVNVSPKQFNQTTFKKHIETLISNGTFIPNRLKLEITESVVLGNVNQTIDTMHSLRALGIGFSMDDFGTGYSSLSYLQRLPLTQIKIDQSFVRDVIDDESDAAIVRTLLTLGNSMSLDVIAEGVETEAQHAFLLANGCKYFQGYLFGKPESLATFRQRLGSSQN